MRGVDVVVVGGGFAGLTLACRLAQDGFEVTVIERQVAPPRARRAVFLQPNGLAALARIDVLRDLLNAGPRVNLVRMCDREGRERAVYSYGELRHPHPYMVPVDPGAFQSVLVERLGALGAELPVTGAEFTELLWEDGNVAGLRYRDASGTNHQMEAPCVVGADGPASAVRRALGIETRALAPPDPYVLGIGNSPDGLPRDEGAVFCGSGYGDGVFPTNGGAYFWDHVTAENRAAVEARDLNAWRAVFANRIPLGDQVAGVLTEWSELIVLLVRVTRVARRTADGVALIGDAAGTVHPQSAQGANLSLEDAVKLGDTLAGELKGAPITTTQLAPWARARERKLHSYQRFSLLTARSLDARGPAWRGMRRAGFGWAHLGPARRELLRWTAGLVGDRVDDRVP
jgi:2-polyprenyl-6-methoxyphenol hydroxylase-like FAD-dependent oxidoreductase